MRTIRTIPEVRRALGARTAGGCVRLVPTMGAIHDGHAALVDTCRSDCDIVVASIFVNPLQFGPGEDLDGYPRTEDSDATTLARHGTDILFAPGAGEMYPAGFATTIDPGPIADRLCGASRPGHFTGVATVVARLLGIVQPDHAYFGAKDFQQTRVIARIVADLAIPVDVRVVPTVREANGLAMSSRNRYLSPLDRAIAPALYRALTAAAADYARGERDGASLVGRAASVLANASLDPEYLELSTPRRSDRSTPPARPSSPWPPASARPA